MAGAGHLIAYYSLYIDSEGMAQKGAKDKLFWHDSLKYSKYLEHFITKES